MSWDWIFQATIIGALLLPVVLAWLEKTQKPTAGVLIGAAILPLILLLGAYALKPQGDLGFHLKLALLSWLPTLLWTSLVYFQLKDPRRVRKTYLIMGLSALFCALAFVATPALTALDPFLGVLPGTVSLDPTISLDLYYLRAVISIATFLVLFVLGFQMTFSALNILILFWLVSLFAAFFVPSPLTPRVRLEAQFETPHIAPPFKIFTQLPKASAWKSSIWAHELSFIWNELKSKLPRSARFRKEPDISVFIYTSDSSKKKWIGAERTQIGNFVRSEMHLSEQELDSEILWHELVHLMHGSLDAPLSSYLDPLIFEGFAVALSAEDRQRTLEQGAALIKAIDQTESFEWPHYLDFFSKFSGPVSYALAGAYAAQTLSSEEFPWLTSADLSALKAITVSEAELANAKKRLERKSLLSDPLARDCSRLYQEFRKNINYASFRDLHSICPDSPITYAAIFDLKDLRELAFRIYASTAVSLKDEVAGDIAVVEERFEDARASYKLAKGSLSPYKLRALEKHRERELKALLLTSYRPAVDVLKLFLPDPEIVSHLLSNLKVSERLELLELVSAKRALSSDERLQLISSKFYAGLLSAPSKNDLKKLTTDLEKLPKSAAQDRLKRRILFEIQATDRSY